MSDDVLAVTVGELVERAEMPLAAAMVLDEIARGDAQIYICLPHLPSVVIAVRIWNRAGASLTPWRAKQIVQRLRAVGVDATRSTMFSSFVRFALPRRAD